MSRKQQLAAILRLSIRAGVNLVIAPDRATSLLAELDGELEQAFHAGWEAKARDVRDQLSDYDVHEAWDEYRSSQAEKSA